jgi:hypothetical protein
MEFEAPSSLNGASTWSKAAKCGQWQCLETRVTFKSHLKQPFKSVNDVVKRRVQCF